MKYPSEVQNLFVKIANHKVVLFIGNGASIDAGGPTTETLVELIKNKFKTGEYTSNDFIQTCTEVLGTTYTPRADLESLIREKLYDLKPSSFHLQLPRLVWPAIFTTNYDDLIEKSYREITDRVQMPDTVFDVSDSLTLHNRDNVKIFKMMGCINSQHPHNKLILTRDDYVESIRTRVSLFKVLQDIMRDGTILFVGYSFRDYLLQDIFNDLIKRVGLNNLPYSYALMPNTDLGSIPVKKLTEEKVIPLSITASDFAEMIRGGIPIHLTPLKDRDDVRVSVKGITRFIPYRDAQMYSQSFEIITEDSFITIQPDSNELRRDFFRGLLKDWTGYVRNWDFKRVQYSEIFKRVERELSDPDVGKNKSMMVFGPAGSGKTMLLSRIAIDAYKQSGNPVVILRPFYEDIDFKLLSSLCETLSTSEKESRSKREGARARVLILMESASSHITDFRTIPIFMKSRGIPVLLLASSRENDWLTACERNNLLSTVDNSVNLIDTFESNRERYNFISHLKSLGILENELTNEYLLDLIQREHHDSFFASMYSLVEPSRPTLEDKISHEYSDLSSMAQKAYLYISSFYQYSLPVPIELLVRTLNCSYEHFLQEIYESAAKKVICEVSSPYESMYFGARHRIIAEKIIEKQIQTMDKLSIIFKDLLRNMNPGNLGEVALCKSLLIRYLGPNGIEKRFSPQQIREMFKTAIDEGGILDASILHHFGLFESDNQNQDKALELVQAALKLVENKSILPFARSERVENFYNTLGLIYSRKGQLAETNHKNDEAELSYSVATDYFLRAKGSVSPNPYPYDSESRMYIYRAEHSEDSTNKLILFISALDVIEEAEDNLPEEELPRFIQLKAMIQEKLQAIENLSEIIASIQKKPELQSLGYNIGIKLYLLNQSQTLEKLSKAYGILEKSISSGKMDISTLRLYSRLFIRLYPNDSKGFYSILKNRYQLPQEKRNLKLLYDLGKYAFMFGEYVQSREYFKELERISQGHSKRWGLLDIGINEKAEKVEFSGTIIQIRNFTTGILDVPQLRFHVPFLPYAQKFQPEIGENVTFNISFNYRGWLAIDLSR